MSLILAITILAGPLPEINRPSLWITVHLGHDKKSFIAARELKNPHHFFKSLRHDIETHYRLVTDDEAFDEPTYSIGRGGTRMKFRSGSFGGSGAFLLSLKSIADIDQWERHYPKERYAKNEEELSYSFAGRDESDKPAVFPPELQERGP